MNYEHARASVRTNIEGSTDTDRTVLAFAHTPWLDDVPATRSFFEAMDAHRADVDATSACEDGDVDRALELLDDYERLAITHGAAGYAAAVAAARSGIPPESVVSASHLNLGSTLPHAITLEVGTTELTLEALASKKGNLWYCVTDGESRGRQRGVAVDEDPSGLPESIRIGGSVIRLGPVPLWDKATRSYIPGEHEPFDVKRGVEIPATIGGYPFEVKVRVTVKKRGGWHVTASAVPQGKVPTADIGKRNPALARDTPMAYDTTIDLDRNQELLAAIRDVN